MRVAVTGGRDFHDFAAVNAALNPLGVTALAHGGASGADFQAKVWAHINAVPSVVYRADWQHYGRRAGPLRNQQMLQDFKPDALVAFPGGRGTAHCVNVAKRLGIPVIAVTPAARNRQPERTP